MLLLFIAFITVSLIWSWFIDSEIIRSSLFTYHFSDFTEDIRVDY